MPWKPCPCCRGSAVPQHAMLDVTCSTSGQRHALRVPWDARHDSIGWGDRPRITWQDEATGEDRVGLEVSRGPQGVTVHTDRGEVHRVGHGRYRVWQRRPPEVEALEKAAKPLKAGQRWITVHPHGDDEKGVPVLIEQTPDKSWRVIAGAGGKLTHLRLKNVKTEEESREAAKGKAKEKRGKERERKKGQTDDQAKQEAAAKKAVTEARLKKQREFIERARALGGGIDEDLDPERMAGLASGTRKLLETQHHKKQLRQAMARADAAANALIESGTDEAQAKALLEAHADEHPDIATHAREIATEHLGLREVEQSELAEERRIRKLREVGRGAEIGAKATQLGLDVIEKAPDPTEELQRLGGTDDDGKVLRETLTASEELRRRALAELATAKTLADVSKAVPESVDELPTEAVKVLEREGLTDADAEVKAQALQAEAARRHRRFEVTQHRAERFEEIEGEEGMQTALNALKHSDAFVGIAKSAKVARDLGLTTTDRVPVKDFEAAEFIDLMGAAAELRAAEKEFQRMQQGIEGGDYDRSRRAFDLSAGEVSEAVQQTIEEGIQRELTERMLGVANQGSADYLQAVAAGHYNALADVALGIGRTRYLDRPTVDALGLKNAAVLTRWAMESDGHESGAVLEALEAHHVAQVSKAATAALAKADAIVPNLSHTVEDVGSLEEAVALLDAHESDLADVQGAVGSAIGGLEATATLGQAFRDKVPDSLTVHAGTTGLDNTLQWMHAVGLRPEDYRVDYKAKTVAIPKTSWEKLIRRDPPELAKIKQTVSDIKAGHHDEEGWLPAGIVSRAASTWRAPVPEAPRYYAPLDMGAGDLAGAVREHVGRRLADGEAPEDILHDLTSADTVRTASDATAYLGHVHELFPVRDAEGTLQKPEFFREHYQKLASDWADRAGREAFHAQDLGVDDPHTHEALYRTLAENPTWKHAFTPVGELTYEGRRALRDYFYDRQGLGSKRSYDDDYNAAIKEIGAEPPKSDGAMSMFGGGGDEPSEDWKRWRRQVLDLAERYPKQGRDAALRILESETPRGRRPPSMTPEWESRVRAAAEEFPHAGAQQLWSHLANQHGWQAPTRQEISDLLAPELHDRRIARLRSRAQRADTPWSQYVDVHGSQEHAVGALQDELRGQFAKRFQEHYGKVTGRALRLGRAEVANRERHIQATATPEQQQAYLRSREDYMAGLRQREDTGRYASMGGQGSLVEAERQGREQDAAASQLQSTLFGGGAPAAAAPAPELKGPRENLGERWSMGDRAEQQIASVMPHIARQFQAGKPVDLFPGLNMDGARVVQQRVVKTLVHNGGRLGGFLGTGSGKSLISIGGFTECHARGQAKRGLYLVPVAVQDQFDGEMLRFTKPGQYRWETGTGKGHADRVAALKNADNHMVVLTHASFRDTALQLMAEHHGRTPEAMAKDLRTADRKTAARWMREAFDANGIPPMFTYYDEAHGATSRSEEGKSLQAAITEAVTHPTNATQFLAGTATPHKNEESEVYSMAAMLDPDRYGDRSDFMSAFGTDLQHNPEAIRRELAHLTYSEKVDPEGVERIVSDNPEIVDGKKVGNRSLDLSPEQHAAVGKVEDAWKAAQAAHRKGQIDVEAVKALSPKQFEGAAPERHREIAERLFPSLAMSRDQALRRAIQMGDPKHNAKLQRMADVIEHDLKHGTWTNVKTGQTHTGKPSIVFTDRAQEAKFVHAELARRGIKVATYTGALDHRQREEIRSGFQPEGGGTPRYDVIVATSAAEAGINLQRAKALHHYDVAQTAKAWAQRTGRAYRQKQLGDVDVHNWHTGHRLEQDALRRLRRKEGLASVFETPLGSQDETGIAERYSQALKARHWYRDDEALAAK